MRSDGVGSGKRNHWREVVSECHDQGDGRGGVPLDCQWRKDASRKGKTGGGQTEVLSTEHQALKTSSEELGEEGSSGRLFIGFRTARRVAWTP